MTLLLQSPSFELWWEPSEGGLRLESPGRALVGVLGVEFVQQGHAITLSTADLTPGRVSQTTVYDAHGQAEQVHIHYQEVQGIALCLRMRLYNTRPFVIFKLSVTNIGPTPVQMRRFFFHTNPHGFQSTAEPLGVYVNGWQSWSPAGFLPREAHGFSPSLPVKWLQGPMTHNAKTPWNGKTGRFWSESVGAVVTSREALVAGGASLADQFVQLYADVRPGHTEVLLQSQADDVPVVAGEACTSEWFYLEWVPLPNLDPLAQYAHAVARQMEIAVSESVPTGWCSWYFYYDQVREADMMENIASAALVADEIPLSVIQLDEGYQSVWGDWLERNAHFPHKLAWLADRIRGSKFVPGLWLGPLTADPKSKLVREHPDWILRNRSGRPVSPGLISGARSCALDPTHPGVQAYLHDLITTVVDAWGFSYLKLDFMYAGALAGQYHNPRMTRAQALRHAFHIIREAAGEQTYLVGCGAPFGPALGLVDAMRIGPDTAPTWGPTYGRLGRLLQKNPSLPSLRNSLHGGITRAWMHNRWWVNDPDTLLIRDTQSDLTDYEVQAQITLAGLCGGLFLLSDDLDALSPERREMAAAVVPLLLEGMDVLDLFDRNMPATVTVPVARPWGRWRLIGLFNWEDKPVERTLPLDLIVNRDKAYHVVDFWERRYFHFAQGAPPPVLHLPPHGTVLLGLRPVKTPPQLVATTFHISQGAEIVAWDARVASLVVRLNLERRAQGEVWLALPARPTKAFINEVPLSDDEIRAVSAGIWAFECRINRRGELRVAWDETTV